MNIHRLAFTGLILCMASGCVDWRIEAPEVDIVLARGNAELALTRAQNKEWPRVRHRQVGLLALGTGSALIPGDEILNSMNVRNHMTEPLKDAAFVTGYHVSDWLIEALTFSIVKSHTVRIYSDVR